jgi:peptidoglycan/xylan/chitin deacetylase (PgdA/CDA1 family)
VTHPRLNSLPEREIEMEIAMSRREVEDRTGAAADTFAYPYGAMNTAARECAGRWFRMSCTTEPAAIAGGCDPARIPRVDAYYLRNRFWFESLGSIHGKTYLFLRRMLHAVRQHVLTG